VSHEFCGQRRTTIEGNYLTCCFVIFVSVESLLESKAVTKSKYDVHKIVMGRNDYTGKDIVVQAHAFTKSAQEAIENAGGKCEVLKHSTGEVISV
jgi:large subunit ribosomal protein L15